MIATNEDRKSSGNFSFIKTLGNLVVNDRFKKGYEELVEKNTNNENTFIWRSLSAIGEDLGNVLYENVLHYIENISDVDTCTLKSLASMSRQLGIGHVKLLDNLDLVPPDVLKLLDLFSINPSLLLNPRFINLPLVEELAVCCTVSSRVQDLSASAVGLIDASCENNPELSGATLSWQINNNLYYENYLPEKFLNHLTSVLSAEFPTRDAVNNVPNRKRYYIFDNIPTETLKGVLVERSNSYEYLDAACSAEISSFIQLNNLFPYFNPSRVLDDINNGTDEWDNYTETEKTLLSGVLERRHMALLGLSGDNVLPQTSRYDYYRARQILDLLLFINDMLGRGAVVETTAWLPDTRYSQLSVNYENDNGAVLFDRDGTGRRPRLNNPVIVQAAYTLADICRSVQILRERLKTFAQQVYLRGSTLLMQFVVNEYLRYTLPYKYSSLVSAIPLISAGWLSDDTYDAVNVVEYWDTTEYFNLSTEHSEYAKNYGYVNYPFWLKPDNDSGTNIIPRPTINDFYMNMLGMNTVLSSRGNNTVDGFLSTIYSMGLLDAYIDNELSTLVLPVDQTAPSALNTSNPGIISTLREYQRFLATTYSGLSAGPAPYYNWKNVTHPSWQVHPYLKNFVEKASLDNIIETTYNITANSMRLAAMKTNRVSACIGEAGEILNLWRFKTEDFSGYLTRYELGRQSLLKWNLEPSPVVNYDGLFYPDAVDDYMNAVSGTENVPMETKTPDGRSISVDMPPMSVLLSSMYGQKNFWHLGPGTDRETFYGRWYSHLQGGFETSSYISKIADQLSVYQTELSGIYTPRLFKGVDAYGILDVPWDERPVDIYKYALDKYLNSYILVKRCHPDTPEHIKKIIPGELWIRFANHPIALPAFGLPDDYLSSNSLLSNRWKDREDEGLFHRFIPQVSMLGLNNCFENYLSAEFDENAKTNWDFVYDFDITEDGNTVVLAVDPVPGRTNRKTAREEDLFKWWQEASLLIGEPERRFDTTPPQYTLKGQYETPVVVEDDWKFAGLHGIKTDTEDSVRSLYLRYRQDTATIQVGEANIPTESEINYVCSQGIQPSDGSGVDPSVTIPNNWDFDWNVTVNNWTPESGGSSERLFYMVVGKVPFFPDDERTPLKVQNWYGRSNAEIYSQNMAGLERFAEETADEINTPGHTYPTEADYKVALYNLAMSVDLSTDIYETQMNMPGLVDYAHLPLLTSTAVTPGKETIWNSAERFGTAVLKIFLSKGGLESKIDQFIINSDASYIPLYPGTDGATRTWPVDNESTKLNVSRWISKMLAGEDVDTNDAYRLYWLRMSDAQKAAEKAAMVENALVNSKQPVAAEMLGPEYDGLHDKIEAVESTISSTTNNDGEQVWVGATTFTGSDAVHRIIEEYDESKYYKVWLKPDATKTKLFPGDNNKTFDIDIPLSYLSVVNNSMTTTRGDMPALKNWNFLIYNIDSPNVPLVAEPVLTTLNRSASNVKINYINIPTAYQKFFLEHLYVKEDLMAIDGNRDLFATGTDRDNTTTNYFMGINTVTMTCNVNDTTPVSDWKVTLHFERDENYIENNFVVDRNQIVAFLYSVDYSQFEDYHFLQHHDIWPYATQLASDNYNARTINERVPIDSEDLDSAYKSYLGAGNRERPGDNCAPFTTTLYPNEYTEGFKLDDVDAISALPGPMLSGTFPFKINEESRSDLSNMFPDFLFYQTMASAFNLVVTEMTEGHVFDLSNTYIMEIVDPMRMVEALGTFDILTYDTFDDTVFMRAYENYMREQYSISKYDRDVVPYLKWYNAIEPYDTDDHVRVYSDVSTAWESERNLELSDINFNTISASRDRSNLGPRNLDGFSYGWLNEDEFDIDHALCVNLSSVVEAVGHGVPLPDEEQPREKNLHTFVPAGVTFGNVTGKRWVTATWEELKNACKLFINYEKTDDGFTLYFNYNNLFHNEYLYMDSHHTFHSCYKDTTYLMLGPGEAGQLELIAQPKVYDAAGNVCGIRDVRLFGFMIKNTSDDKPKFDVIKTYELAKGGLPQLDYPADAGAPGAVYVETVEKETDVELTRQGVFDFVTTEDFNVVVPGEIVDDYGCVSISCDFLYEGFNPYLVCNYDACTGGTFTNAGLGRIHFETKRLAAFSLSFSVLAGQYVSENELNFQIPIEIESAYGTGQHGEIINLNKIPGGANIMFVGESTESRALAKEPAGYDVEIRNKSSHGGFVLTEAGGTGRAKGKPIAVFTPLVDRNNI